MTHGPMGERMGGVGELRKVGRESDLERDGEEREEEGDADGVDREEGGEVPEACFLPEGGELQTDPRGDTETPESQESFLLSSTGGLRPSSCLLPPSILLPRPPASCLWAGLGEPWGDCRVLNLW